MSLTSVTKAIETVRKAATELSPDAKLATDALDALREATETLTSAVRRLTAESVLPKGIIEVTPRQSEILEVLRTARSRGGMDLSFTASDIKGRLGGGAWGSTHVLCREMEKIGLVERRGKGPQDKSSDYYRIAWALSEPGFEKMQKGEVAEVQRRKLSDG